ncbi:ATP-binding protein [Crocosphaera sp. Alani8]|uniref:ATP-binding protein n=1 Tax=Crocosphaera sp. Alani8 TaxID=3038952 RepID=UPI00313B82CD
MVRSNQQGTNPQSLLKPFQLTVKSEILALEKILIWFETVAKPYLPPQVLWECKLALSEGFTNTVLYAHDNLPATVPIIINVNFYHSWVDILIWDEGPFFDLKTKLAQLKQEQTHPLELEGDRGLFFMDKLTDELDYIRVDHHKNCLKMKKILIHK